MQYGNERAVAGRVDAEIDVTNKFRLQIIDHILHRWHHVLISILQALIVSLQQN